VALFATVTRLFIIPVEYAMFAFFFSAQTSLRVYLKQKKTPVITTGEKID
jgi:hypothetical protein